MEKILVIFGKDTDGSQLTELVPDVKLMFVDMGEKKARDFIRTNNIKCDWLTLKNGSKHTEGDVINYLFGNYVVCGIIGFKYTPKAKADDMKKKEPEHVFETEAEANKAIADFKANYKELYDSCDWGVETRYVKQIANKYGASRVTRSHKNGHDTFIVRFTLKDGRYQNINCIR